MQAKSLYDKNPVAREQRRDMQELERDLFEQETARHEQSLRDLHFLRAAIAGYDLSDRFKPSDSLLTSLQTIKDKHATPKPKAD
jgi:hypothetical protein